MDRKEAEGVIDFIKNAMETPLQKSITISDACSSETFLLSEIKTIYMAPVRIRLIYNSQNILVKSEMLNVNQNEIYFNGGVN
jgi:exoribonuclease II